MSPHDFDVTLQAVNAALVRFRDRDEASTSFPYTEAEIQPSA
jgi:hypothetical protein